MAAAVLTEVVAHAGSHALTHRLLGNHDHISEEKAQKRHKNCFDLVVGLGGGAIFYYVLGDGTDNHAKDSRSIGRIAMIVGGVLTALATGACLKLGCSSRRK